MLSPRITRFTAVSWRLSSSVSVALTALTALLLAGGCEDKGLGRPCSLGENIPADQGAYSVHASECQSHICVKPAIQPGVVADSFDTGPYCSFACSSDNDCESGQMRDRSDSNDKRCKTGFTCAVPFGASDSANKGGDLCCKRICLCRDFFSATVHPGTPAGCGTDESCPVPERDR
jgi:hypothetical protein